MNAESNPEMSAQEWLNKYKNTRRSRGIQKRREISYLCHLYAHEKCKGRFCKCRCHKQ